MNMREKAIKNTIICAYKNLKSKAYKKIVMALMIFMAAIQVGIISNNKIKAAQTENNQYEINIALKNENVIFADREVRIYKIADKNEKDEYVLLRAFAKYPIEVNDIKNNSDLSKIANTISGYISLDGISADYVGTTNEQGKMKYEKTKEKILTDREKNSDTFSYIGDYLYTDRTIRICSRFRRAVGFGIVERRCSD